VEEAAAVPAVHAAAGDDDTINKIEIKTGGMHCVSCERLIEDAVMELDGIKKVKSDYVREKTSVEFDAAKTSENKILKKIREAGYEAEPINKS
jgi:copper chaperone CopZ